MDEIVSRLELVELKLKLICQILKISDSNVIIHEQLETPYIIDEHGKKTFLK